MPRDLIRRGWGRALLLAGGVSAAAAGMDVPAQAAPTSGSVIAIAAGDGTSAAVVAGAATGSPLDEPHYLAADGLGNVFVGFSSGTSNEDSVAKVDTQGRISVAVNAAGTDASPQPGPAAASPLCSVRGLAAAANGTLYVSDGTSHRVLKVSPAGTLSMFAGAGTGGAIQPGPALGSPLTPSLLAVGRDGSLYVADNSRNQVVKVTPAGALSILAGTGTWALPTTGGPATSSDLGNISSLAVDTAGNVFILDYSAGCVVMIDAGTGDLEPAAGTCGAAGSPSPGPATATALNSPYAMAVDRFDNLYISDASGYLSKVNDPASGAGTLSFFAGNGSTGPFTPGPASSSNLSDYPALALTPDLDLYFVDDSAYLGVIAGVPSPPSAPRNLQVTLESDRRVSVRFDPPTDDGGVIRQYEYTLDGGSTWLPGSGRWQTTTSGAHLTAVVRGLTNGHTYSFRVRATTRAGAGPASAPASGTPVADQWFHDVISPAARAKEIKVPAKPWNYAGPRKNTRARNRAYGGQLAMPVPAINGRPLAQGQAAVLSGRGLFDFDDATLTPAIRRQLTLLAASLDDATAIQCQGYTDYAGSRERERRLSLQRARAVCTALQKLGVDARATVRGYAWRHPVVVGGSPRSRDDNRRVIVLVTRA